MPMKTTFLGAGRDLAHSCRVMSATCSRISDVSRSPIRFIVPVAQNWQPMAQPICEDTQTVVRDLWRMATLSTRWPSRSSMTSFVVCVSFDSATWASLDEKSLKFCDASSTATFGSFWRPSMQYFDARSHTSSSDSPPPSRSARITTRHSRCATTASKPRCTTNLSNSCALKKAGLPVAGARPRRGGITVAHDCDASDALHRLQLALHQLKECALCKTAKLRNSSDIRTS